MNLPYNLDTTILGGLRKMKLSKKLSIFTFLLLLSILFLAPVKANAATVGQQLTSPEEGWQRFDDLDPNLTYSGVWVNDNNSSYSHYFWKGGSSGSWGGSNPSSISFKFYGTKIRLLSPTYTNKRTDNTIIIDNISETFSEYASSGYQTLVYEKSGLDLGIHTVVIKPSADITSAQNIYLDSIDIDATGYLIDYNQINDLTAIAGDKQIKLTWSNIDGVSNYSIKRSTTSNGPYETIGTSTTNSFTDIGLTNGTKYYYVVTPVVSGNEKTPSNEASATPTAITNPDYLGNSATLVITMTNGGIKEYSLPIVDIDKFITWYDNKSDGTGKSYYTFTKSSNIVPYLRIKEYISFDKISSFEVKEFNQ
jgi:hypothetical protein